jgi:hypothetical protein
MSLTIHKYRIPKRHQFTLDLPRGATILSVRQSLAPRKEDAQIFEVRLEGPQDVRLTVAAVDEAAARQRVVDRFTPFARPDLNVASAIQSARPLSTDREDYSQNVCLWAEVDPEEPKVGVTFYSIPTGGEVPRGCIFVDTVLADAADGSEAVFHIYMNAADPGVSVNGREN